MIFISVNSLNNIINMSLFMQIEIVRYLLLFGESTLVLFIYHVLLLYTRKLFFILVIINIL